MYFVLDFGGTYFRVNWTESLDEADVVKNTHKIRNTGNYRRDSNKVLKIMESVSAKADGIVVALPGDFNSKKMVLNYANNLKEWISQPFFKLLESDFECDLVVVDKDSSIAGIGEGLNNRLGENKFLYITWGTGVGGCVVISNGGCLPKIKILKWSQVFKRIDALCGGGNAAANFGVGLKLLDSMQWNILVENFVNELEKICKSLNLRSVVLGGGVTEKRRDVVLIIEEEMKKRGVRLVRSCLGDFSAIYGGYALLRSKVSKLNNYS